VKLSGKELSKEDLENYRKAKTEAKRVRPETLTPAKICGWYIDWAIRRLREKEGGLKSNE
jgi:hypothetical protein